MVIGTRDGASEDSIRYSFGRDDLVIAEGLAMFVDIRKFSH